MMAYAKRRGPDRTEREERALDRLRAVWQLSQLADAGKVTSVQIQHSMPGMRYLITTPGWIGERSYRTTRELEAFIHGAFSALGA